MRYCNNKAISRRFFQNVADVCKSKQALENKKKSISIDLIYYVWWLIWLIASINRRDNTHPHLAHAQQ